MKLRSYTAYGDPEHKVIGYHHWCPACDEPHGIATGRRNHNGAIWRFDGNFVRPTFSPSIRCFTVDEDGRQQTLCHYFITAGLIRFCNDNPHALNGQTVELPEWPDNRRNG